MAEGGDMSDVYKPSRVNVKRKQFLACLPAEHQNFFASNDRYLVQNAGHLTRKGTKVFSRIAFRPQQKLPLLIASYEGSEEMTAYARSCIHAFSVSTFYDQEWDDITNPFLASTLGGLLSILASYTSYDSLVCSGLETALEKCHIQVSRVIWRTLDEVNEETKVFRDRLAIEMGLNSFDESPQVFTIIALSLLVLIGKNVTDNNREGWFRNRWKALAQVANIRMDVEQVKVPLLLPCKAIYSSASANQPVRSCIFEVMRSLASITEDKDSVLFDRLIRLLQWTEMSHMWMIMQHVYDQNPDILNFPELGGPEVASMTIALQFLKKFPKDIRAFVKLVYDHNELTPLHSSNFIYFTAAAHAISSLTKASIINMTSRFSEGVKAFQGKVLDYINARNKIGPISAAVSYGHTLPLSVKTALMKAVGDTYTEQEIPDFVDRQPEARE